MPDPAALAKRLVALAARLAEIRANHVGCEAVWQQWIAEGQIEPDKVLPTPICCLCDVFGAYDALAEAVLAFAAKYDELDPAVKAAFVFQATHGFPYTGPTWEVERSAMLALARAGRRE